MKIVILIAGIGSRLGTPLPKCLTPLRPGYTILDHQLENMQAFARDIVAVVGFKKDVIEERYPDLQFVHNSLYEKTNTSQSLLIALQPIREEDVLFLNGDVVFDARIIRAVLECKQSCMAVTRSPVTDEEVKFSLDARHKAAFTHVVHKKVMALSPPFFHMDDTQGDATHLLQECDAIVGDYSSLVIDALLFDRPLALWCEDFESYTSQRPLPYFDFHDTFGWAVKSGLPELRDWIEERLQSSPPTPAEVHGFTRCRAMFHQHARGGSGERVLEAVRARLKGPHPAE